MEQSGVLATASGSATVLPGAVTFLGTPAALPSQEKLKMLVANLACRR
jgi:hypothetical protein